MSEQDNTLPPGWTAETIREACGNRYSNRHFKDKPSWGFMQDDLFALLRKAYEQGRREVEEAVGVGGISSRNLEDAARYRHWRGGQPNHCRDTCRAGWETKDCVGHLGGQSRAGMGRGIGQGN